MATAASVGDALDALLLSSGGDTSDLHFVSSNSDNDDEYLLLSRQAVLCQRLLESLERQSKEYGAQGGVSSQTNSSRRTSLDSAADSTDSSSRNNNKQPTNFIHTSIEYNNKSKASADSKTRRKKGPSLIVPPDATMMTVRELFAESNSTTSNLPSLLANLMVNRVDTEKILPPTQDAQANEDAMNSISALTLTKPALIATELYAKLLAMPGAFGAGLIEMEAVSAMAALFRRWRTECIAAMDLLLSEKQKSNAAAKNKKKRTGKRKSSKKAPKEANPTKRNVRRNPKRTVNFDLSSSSSSSEEDASDSEEDVPSNLQKASVIQELVDDEDEDDDDIISPTDLIMLGLKAALAMSEVPLQREFMSWSSESREAIIDAVTALYGTACALVTPSVENKLSTAIVELRGKVVDRATVCLKQCILRGGSLMIGGNDDDDTGDEDDDDVAPGKTSISAKRHETSVFIFRGLFPAMSMKETLPNGEAGKQQVCEMVAETIQGFVKGVTEDMSSSTSMWTPASTANRRSNNNSTVSRRESLPANDPATPVTAPKTTSKKGKKKRVSFGGVDSQRTPLLKSSKKAPQPGSANSTPGQALAYLGTKPRPVLSAVLGLLQKLATVKGLEKAHFRASIVKSLHTCLRYLPSLERSFFLRFLNQLCQSKVSIHRLLAAELVGLILAEPWLWKDHTNQPCATPKAQSTLPQSAVKTPRPKTPNRSALSMTPGSPDQQSVFQSMDEEIGLDIPSSLLESLKGRLTDKIPTVRARAAGSMADLLKKVSPILLNNDKENDVIDDFAGLRKCLSNDGYCLVFTLRKRALSDEKATVRKTAIGALVELLLLGHFSQDFNFGIGEDEIISLGELCRDSSVQTRKSAAQAITTILEKCSLTDGKNTASTINLLERTWAASVLPLVLDSESTSVAKAVELVQQIILQPITTSEESEAFDRRSYLTAWRILTTVCEGSSGGAARGEVEALKATLTKVLASSDDAANNVHRALLRRICDVAVLTLDGEPDDLCEPEIECQRAGVWCLFDALVDQTKDLAGLYRTLKKLNVDLDFLGTSWEKMLKLLETADLPTRSGTLLRACMRSCLRLLSKLASCVHPDVAHRSGANLQLMLKRFTLPPDLIGSAVHALASTSIVCSGEDAEIDIVRSDCKERIKALYDTCEDTISSYAKEASDAGQLTASEEAEEAMIRAIYLCGECSILGFSPDEDDDAKRGGQNKKNGVATESDPLRGFNVQPSRQLVDLVLTFLPRHFLTTDSILTPETARAHAFTTVGKFCLRNETLAKQCLTIFARELHENLKDGCPRVQSNALLVLGDLCIRYTSMVDRHLPVIAACLQSGHAIDDNFLGEDKSAIVRKHAILLLSSLLLQDYIKWRGLLFHRFLVSTADNDESVASIGESMLMGPLLNKCPKLLFNNFTESLFVLNRCTAHPIFLAAASAGDGGGGIAVGFEGINLSGRVGRVKRFRMYELMLSKMSDEEKIGITARLAKEVLGSALSTGSDLHRVCTNPVKTSDGDRTSDRAYESAANVISDCLGILTSPALRVGKSSHSNDDDNDIIEDPNVPGNAARRVIAARGKLLSKISRKQCIEIIFPILVNLKAILQSSCSPLAKDLCAVLLHIYKLYKQEVTEFLAADPTTLAEIVFDAAREKRQSKTPAKAAASEEEVETASPEATEQQEVHEEED